MNNELKIYISPRQTAIIGNSDKDKKFNGDKIITIEGNKFSMELPMGNLVSGSITFEKTENGEDVYLTDTDCPLVISKDEIKINLYRTHECFIVYDLRKEEPKKSFFQKLWGK